MTALMWFRRDLRLADNPALVAAAESRSVVALFVVDPRFTGRAGANRLAHLWASLRALDASIGGNLVVRHGDPLDVVPRVAAEVAACVVWVARDGGPYGRQRDRAVAQRLSADGRHLRGAGSPYLMDPGRIVKADGTPYRVFTPFHRAWRQAAWPAPVAAPDPEWLGPPAIASEPIPPAPPGHVELPPVSERAALDRWDAFVAEGLDDYAARRDLPGADGTSRLSASLRFGLLHPRQLMVELGDSEAHTTFASELAWRDFYADVLRSEPGSAWRNLQHQLDGLPVDTDARARARFETWTSGRTGYPLVDAGMRQLAATGWMHNRVRMVAASFLVKDLHLPWQWGARHFLRHLVDGDLASNNHGWQWAAGTGTDAAPFFRVFNPVTQSQRFDPDGAYLRRWVPELGNLPDRDLHAPWRARTGRPDGYPAPMVDHAEEREEALRRYALVSRR
jgi:deoxyribodipyrimidine photo-lyase